MHEGINPAEDVATGSANMPAPIAVPATSNEPLSTLKFNFSLRRIGTIIALVPFLSYFFFDFLAVIL